MASTLENDLNPNTHVGLSFPLGYLGKGMFNRTKTLAESFEPLEKQLEHLLDELDSTLRPRIEKPIRKRPLVAIGLAASLGVLLGILMSGGRKS